MAWLNLGILAHVDAGKTSLTERLLHAAGVIDNIGRVDDGSTQTDTLSLERQRGITIKAAVVSFDVEDATVNLIDTPGHPDFIAEVERVLTVLDGAVLVVSAVEGVQPQTRVLMRTLRRLRIPTLLFVNKIDRRDARPAEVLADLRSKLGVPVVALGTARRAGGKDAAFVPYADTDTAALTMTAEVLADVDEQFLADYLADGAALAPRRIRAELAAQSRAARAHPVLFGSAITGAGVPELIKALPRLLPAGNGDPDGPLAGAVFKIDRGPAGDKIAYARLFSGAIRVRDRIAIGPAPRGRVTGLRVFVHGGDEQQQVAVAGQIAKLSGLVRVRIGDVLGRGTSSGEHLFAPPTLETVVAPERTADRGALYTALSQLAEQDPLINLRTDGEVGQIALSLYGEVQKEVIEATLAEEYGVRVRFTETTTLCIERPVGTGEAVERIGTDDNPILAGVGLRIEPAAAGSGVSYRLSGEVRGTMPVAFFNAVEESVHRALQRGLRGWPVTDCVVTLTATGYYPRQSHAHATFDKSMSSTAGDFRLLTPMVLGRALAVAGTAVLEPIHRFRLELPAELLGPILPVLAGFGAIPHTPITHGPLGVIEGDVPAARVHELLTRLPGLTHGEGVLETVFDHYEPVRGAPPERA